MIQIRTGHTLSPLGWRAVEILVWIAAAAALFAAFTR